MSNSNFTPPGAMILAARGGDASHNGSYKRTEPTKEENEAAVRALNREARGEKPIKYRDARWGVAAKLICLSVDKNGHYVGTTSVHGYAVYAIDDCGQFVEVAFFMCDDFDGGKRRATARILAQELADSLNENA